MARIRFVAVLLTAVVAVTLTACGSDSSSKDATKDSTTTTTETERSTTTTTVAAAGGPCGDQADAITAAIENSTVAGIDQQRGQYTVTNCRIAASDPTYAAAGTLPNPGVMLDGATVVLHRVDGSWAVEDIGTSGTGCDLSATIQSDLALVCPS